MLRAIVFVICLLLASSENTEAAAASAPFRGVVVSSSITEQDVQDLAAWKVKVVRYLFVFQHAADSANKLEYMKMLEAAMAALDEKLPLFEKYGVQVVLNLYTPPGGFKSHEGPAWHRLFAEKWAQDAFVEVWNKIATHYAASRTVFAFDLLNEPAERQVVAGLKNWNALAAETALVIRRVDPVHRIIVESAYGTAGRLLTLSPLKVPNIMYSIHTYSYAPFRMQGFGGRPINVAYPTKKFNKSMLTRSLQNVKSFQRRSRAPIYIGEFSAVRWAPSGSAYRYLNDILQIFERNKWSWTYHAFREFHAWSVEHDANPSNHEPVKVPTSRERLLRKYFRK